MGRRPHERSKRIDLRVTPEERSRIGKRAEQAGLSLSEYLRRVALGDPNHPVIRTDVEALRAVYRDLKRAGGNINQCARALNRGGAPHDFAPEISVSLQAVGDAAASVSDFIAKTQDCI